MKQFRDLDLIKSSIISQTLMHSLMVWLCQHPISS